MDPSASSGPGRGSGLTSSSCGTDGRRMSGADDGLLVKVVDEEPPIRLESSEGEDVTPGDVPREEGGLVGSRGFCDA